MRNQKVIIALLMLVALLLAANLMVSLGFKTGEAKADIVEGKNVFSTHSPDGSTIYLWGYTQTGSLQDFNVKVQYFGKIGTEGTFQRP